MRRLIWIYTVRSYISEYLAETRFFSLQARAREGRVGELKLRVYKEDGKGVMDIIHEGELSRYLASRGRNAMVKDRIVYID